MSKEIDIVIQAQDQASAKLKSVGNSLNSMGSNLTGLNGGLASVGSSMGNIATTALGFGLAQAGIASLTAVVQAAGQAFISYNAKMEQAQIGFETMLGSAAGAETFIAQLSKMAADTPFEFPQLQQAAQKFLAFGFSAKDVIPTLTAVGNAAAGLGIGQEGIQRMTIALGQMKAKGVVQGDELLQLAEAGIPAYQILSEKMGLTAEQVRKIGEQGISAEDAIVALTQGMNERFPDMMKRQSETAIGVFSTIKDNAGQIFGAIGQPLFNGISGPLKQIRDLTNTITDSLRTGGLEKVFQDMIPQDWQDRIAKIADIFSHLFGPLTDEANAAGSVWKAAFDLLGAAIDASLPTLDLFVQAFGIVWSTISDLLSNIATYVSETIADLGAGWQELKNDAADKFGGIYDTIIDVWTSIGDSMGQIWEAIKSSIWEQVSEFVNGILNRIGPLGNLIRGVGNSLAKAWASVGNMAPSTGNNFRSWLGVLKKPPSVTQEGLEALNNHKGTPAIESGGDSKAAKAAEKLANRIDKLEDRIQDTFNSLNQKILAETSTTYQLGMAKVTDEIDKIQRELMEDASKLGIDTSGLQAKLTEYGQAMSEPIKRAWRDAWTDLKNQSALGIAQLTGDKKAEAAAQEQISLAALEKEKRERLKAVMQDGNDEQAKAAVQAWYENQKLLITQKRLDTERQNKITAFNEDIEQNDLLLTMHTKTQEQVDKLNRDVLDKKIAYLQNELKNEKLTADQINAIRKELASAISAKDSTPLTMGEGIKKGLQDASKQFGTWASNWATAAQSAAIGMRDAFQDFFFDAMTGKLKSLGDYFKSFLNSVAKAISQVFANLAAQSATNAILKWAFPGSKFATGGRATSGSTFLSGENGPELISLDGAGATITSTQATQSALSSAGNANVEVNVYNNTGTQAGVKQESRFDGQRYVVDVWLDAYAKNVGGLRTVTQGAR